MKKTKARDKGKSRDRPDLEISSTFCLCLVCNNRFKDYVSNIKYHAAWPIPFIL